MIQFQENAETDGRAIGKTEGWTDLILQDIGPFQLTLGVQN